MINRILKNNESYAEEQVYICKTELLRLSHVEQPLGALWRAKVFSIWTSCAEEKDWLNSASQMHAEEAGRAANNKCQSIQQALFNNAEMLFQELLFLPGLHNRKKNLNWVQDRQIKQDQICSSPT